jgi:flagellar biosynthesis protein FlhG
MDDQASGLRKLLGQVPDLHAIGLFGADAGLTARATAALADALARRGAALWVLDELPPPTNVAAQFGVHAKLGLGDLAGGIILPDEAMPGVDGGARILGVPGGARSLAGVEEARWQALLQGLEALPNRPEWLLIHADASCCAHSIALMAETRILITQARKAALTDTYGLLKVAEQSHPGGRWRVLMMNVGEMDAAMLAFDRLADTARRFLGVDLELLGMAPRDARLEQASRQMRPLLDLAPHSPAAQAFRRIADTIFEQIGEKAFQWHDFWQKMWLFSRTHAHLPREHGMQTRSDRRAW